MVKRFSWNGEHTYAAIGYAMIFLLAFISFYPVFYVVSLSLTSQTEMAVRSGFFVFPMEPTITSYRLIFRQTDMYTNALFISVLRTVVGTAFSLTPSLICGYIVSRKHLPFKKGILVFILITILFNGGLIPTYLTVRATGIYNTFWAMIIPGLVDSWNVLVFKQFFENVPSEVEESAHIDGVGEISLMFRVVIPMSLPVIAALGLFTAVGHWNAWFDALIYLTDDKLRPMQLILRNMFNDNNFSANMVANSGVDIHRVSEISLRMAVAVVGIVPIMCVYPFLQKYFVKGVYVGAVKG